jgi:hypothetical protein
MTENLKKIIGVLIVIFLFIIIIFYSYKINTNNNNQYIGSKDNDLIKKENTLNNEEVNITGTVQEGTPFSSRNISGGGEKPGWLISVSETQPKVFTGKLFTNEGIEMYNLFMQEENNFLAGEAKSSKNPNDIQALTMQKTDGSCLDSEKNFFEYKLSINFKGETLNGCGGKAVAK